MHHIYWSNTWFAWWAQNSYHQLLASGIIANNIKSAGIDICTFKVNRYTKVKARHAHTQQQLLLAEFYIMKLSFIILSARRGRPSLKTESITCIPTFYLLSLDFDLCINVFSSCFAWPHFTNSMALFSAFPLFLSASLFPLKAWPLLTIHPTTQRWGS